MQTEPSYGLSKETGRTPTDRDPQRVNIVFQDSIPAGINTRVLLHGGTVIHLVPALKLAVADNGTSENQTTFEDSMRSYGDTSAVFPDMYANLSYIPNDPYFRDNQDNLNLTGVPTAWEHNLGDHSRRYAIIDTGVYCFHPDLQANCDVTNSTDAVDTIGHGTMIAGIVGATIDNAKGVAGVTQSDIISLGVPCPVASIHHAPTGEQVCPNLRMSDAAVMLDRAVQLKVNVISLSWGLTFDCANPADLVEESVCNTLHSAIQEASGQDILIAAAAGNDACGSQRGYVNYPAAFPEVIAVGGVNSDKTIWQSSPCGPQMDLVAPYWAFSTVPSTLNSACALDGAKVETQLDGAYCLGYRTSFSAPLVAAIGTLIWSKCPSLTHDNVASILYDSAENLGVSSDKQGHGMVRADQAMNATLQWAGCPSS